MHIRSDLPHAVRLIEHQWVPLADGARLAIRVWLPETAAAAPVPAILEYHPYRKNDATAPRDEPRYRYLAGHGYACVRLEIRGSGDSDGVLFDEYTQQEQDDAVEVIAWIAAQPWCTGKVGMIGVSWSGFNGLQVAARRPPALKAVISACSTDDRYADDVHYLGGCLNACDALVWASVMLGMNALPPDPTTYGAGWRDLWLRRLQESPAFIDAWLSHQRRDTYWQHGSISEEYAAIEAAVYMVGGWADGYSNAIPRTLANLPAPCKAILGPWAHGYPNTAVPGPQVGFLQETLRWFDYWLKDLDTGIMAEWPLRAWIQEYLPPNRSYAERPGRWVTEPCWPPTDQPPMRQYLAANGIVAYAADPSLHATIGTNLAHGWGAQVWCPYGAASDFADDQRHDDSLALCFTSAPLEHDIDLLGAPILAVEVAADAAIAQLVVRLCDVAPTGESLLISYGMLNLTHRESHEFPTPLVPGQYYQVQVQLNDLGHRIPAGHRWRVALAPSYWPIAWPAPTPVTLTILGGENSYVELPVRSARPEDANLAPFPEPESAPAMVFTEQERGVVERATSYDRVRRRHTYTEQLSHGRFTIAANGITYDDHSRNTWSFVEGDPLSACNRSETELSLTRGDWHIRIVTDSTLSADAEAFHVTTSVHGYEGQRRIFANNWAKRIGRDLG